LDRPESLVLSAGVAGAAMQLAAVTGTTAGFYFLARNAALQPQWR